MKDALGKEIEIGDLVAFAVRDCNSSALGAGRVVDIRSNGRIMIERVINTSRFRLYQKLEPHHKKIVGCEFPERMAVIEKGAK
ncbi:MAG: hypothetical protein A4E20_01355 [Nitrospira sp. SG-bin2]|uniref:hypothetical protein n=1 Tax=Nitrospira cf. moscoviensis SBR1015 TaxID=96242 RepID=UPI000A097F2B|nr:hypothetical protein [Nitrospira cf. moscoviensis SBR1015]OQW34851.1 MAG: hypothetical protein A4E20_01355 [Nitrospira sp. SG-bin2]